MLVCLFVCLFIPGINCLDAIACILYLSIIMNFCSVLTFIYSMPLVHNRFCCVCWLVLHVRRRVSSFCVISLEMIYGCKTFSWPNDCFRLEYLCQRWNTPANLYHFCCILCCHLFYIIILAIKHIVMQLRGVNLYVFHVSLTDFHCFDWLTYVRGNPYGFMS